MFEALFRRLSDRYHLVAPDYPASDTATGPTQKPSRYTFDHRGSHESLQPRRSGLSRYTLYMQDYGGRSVFAWPWPIPTGSSPHRPGAVAHNEGLGGTGRRGARSGPIAPPNESTLRTNLFVAGDDAGGTRHVGKTPTWNATNPELWTDEFAFLNQPGQADIQSDLFYRLPDERRGVPSVADLDAGEAASLLVLWGQI